MQGAGHPDQGRAQSCDHVSHKCKCLLFLVVLVRERDSDVSEPRTLLHSLLSASGRSGGPNLVGSA